MPVIFYVHWYERLVLKKRYDREMDLPVAEFTKYLDRREYSQWHILGRLVS